MACSKLNQKNMLDAVLECGICLSVFTDPKTLPCLHTYCSECMKQVVKVIQDGVLGLQCPKCRSFTPAGKYVNLFILNELLDVYKLADHYNQKCHLCKEENAEWRCINCKINLCLRCQELHNKTPNCKDHKYVTVDEESKYIFDNNIHCEEHPDEVVSLYCVRCRKCICFYCKVTSHDGHKTETIDATTVRLTEQMVVNLQKIKQNIEKLSKESTEINTTEKNTMAGYKATIDTFEQKYNYAVNKLQQELEMRKQDLYQEKMKEEEKFRSVFDENRAEIREQQSKVMLATAILQNTQGSSLIRALEQSGLMQRITEEAVKIPTRRVINIKQASYQSDVTIQESEILLDETNYTNVTMQQSEIMLGKTIYTNKYRAFGLPEYCDGRLVMGCYKNILENMKLVTTFDIKGSPWRIGLVNDRMWISELDPSPSKSSYLLNIYDTDSTLLKTLKTEPIRSVRDLVQVNSTEVIVSAYNGIFVLTTEGEMKYKVTDSNYGYISTDGEKVASVSLNDEVVILTQRDTKWQIQHKFQITKNPYKTIHLHNDVIYTGREGKGHVNKYSHDGKLIQKLCYKSNSDFNMRVCGSDTQGSVICCDLVSNCIYIVSITGDWQSVTLNGVSRVRDVCVCGEHVYVLHENDKNYRVSEFLIKKP